jgi:LPXTG-motif cell wall-anchored protein
MRKCIDVGCHSTSGKPDENKKCIYIPATQGNSGSDNIDANTQKGKVIEVCEENWSCTEWNSCLNGKSERECIDTKQCGTEANKPEMEKECVEGMNMLPIFIAAVILIALAGVWALKRKKK